MFDFDGEGEPCPIRIDPGSDDLAVTIELPKATKPERVEDRIERFKQVFEQQKQRGQKLSGAEAGAFQEAIRIMDHEGQQKELGRLMIEQQRLLNDEMDRAIRDKEPFFQIEKIIKDSKAGSDQVPKGVPSSGLGALLSGGLGGSLGAIAPGRIIQIPPKLERALITGTWVDESGEFVEGPVPEGEEAELGLDLVEGNHISPEEIQNRKYLQAYEEAKRQRDDQHRREKKITDHIERLQGRLDAVPPTRQGGIVRRTLEKLGRTFGKKPP